MLKDFRSVWPVDGPKSIKCRIFLPFGKGSQVRLFHAPRERHFTEESIDDLLDKMADALEATAPGHEYRIVDISARSQARFNFVWVRELPRIPPATKYVAMSSELVPAEAHAEG